MIGDADRGGDPGLVIDSGHGQVCQSRLLLSHGKAHFDAVTKTHLRTDTNSNRAAVFVDTEGDGGLDLVFTNGDGPLPLYLTIRGARDPSTPASVENLVRVSLPGTRVRWR